MFDTNHFHPMLVHFPVALITVGFLFEVLYVFYKKEMCFSKASFYLLLLGTLGAIAAFTTGHLFTTEPTQGSIVPVFIQHETGALATLIIMLMTSVLKIYMMVSKKEDSSLKWLYFILYFIGMSAVGFTGFKGGVMVFNYMIGI